MSTTTALRLHWPTDSLVVIQPFGANFSYYRRRALPGHPGLDLEASPGSTVTAPVDGRVTAVGDDAVQIATTADERAFMIVLRPLTAIRVAVGQAVTATTELGVATGPVVTLQLTRRDATARHETAYPNDIVDPTPYLQRPAAVVIAAGRPALLREGPQRRAARVARVAIGDPLQVLRGWRSYEARAGERGSWLYVEAPSGARGWIAGNQVSLPTAARDLIARVAPLTVSVNVNVARLRAGPGLEFDILNRLMLGTALTVISNLEAAPDQIGVEGKWLNVRTPWNQTGWIAAHLVTREAPPITAWPAGRCLVGVHGKADPWPFEAPDFETVRIARVEAVKLLTPGHGVQTIQGLRALNPNVFLLARLFAKPGDSPMGPAQFVAEVRGGLAEFLAAGVADFEIHNEPNLDVDGLFRSWQDGVGFNGWYLEVLARLRAEFPAARFGFPGLSPGPAIPGRREDWLLFLERCREAIERSDWIGAHCYWRDEQEMLAPEGGQCWRVLRSRYPRKLIFITEFSNPAADVSFEAKGDQYVKYYTMLRNEPNLGAAFSYVLAASASFEHENWRKWKAELTAIPFKVGARPT